MSDDRLSRLLDLMVDVFGVDRAELSLTTEADDVADWDSLRTIHLATALEAEFGVELSPDEIAALQSVRAAIEVLDAKSVR